MEQNVPKRRHIKFRRQGITQKKTHNNQNTAKVWNQEQSSCLNNKMLKIRNAKMRICWLQNWRKIFIGWHETFLLMCRVTEILSPDHFAPSGGRSSYCCCFIMQLYKTRTFLNSNPATHLYKVRKFSNQHSEWTRDYSSSSVQMAMEKLYLYGWSRREIFSLSSQEEGNFHQPELSWRTVLRIVYS